MPLTPLNFPSIPAVPLVPVPSNPFAGRTPPTPYLSSDWIQPSPCKTTVAVGDFYTFTSKIGNVGGGVIDSGLIQSANETYYNNGTCITYT